MKRFKSKRKTEKWTSNNRVLMGASKRDPGRNPNFDTEETRLLITLWGDPIVQRNLVTSHRKHVVIAKLAQKLSEYGYNRSVDEISTRLKNLKCCYNRLKKDIHQGIILGSTWKHFAAMDEIMSRSVFSVQPKEVPKPSTVVEMQMKQREESAKNQKKAKTTKAEKSRGMSLNVLKFSDGYASSEEELAKYDNVNIAEIMDTHVIKDEELSDAYSVEEAPLLMPKEEPVDEEIIQITPTQRKMPAECSTTRLPDFIQLPNNNNNNTSNSNSMGVSSNCRTLVNCSLTNGLQTTTTSSSAINGGLTQSIIIANQGSSMQPTGKISLVPTNFLLQNGTQSPQIQIRQQPQPRIICSQPNATTNGGIVTSAGAGRMKVLLVNAFQNGKTTSATVPKDGAFSNPSLISTANIHKTNATDPVIPKIPMDVPKQGKADEVPSTKDPGIDTLFNKLIVMQTENNEIQRQRLEVERQRFEFEKSIADKLLLALTSTLSYAQRPEYTNANNTMNSNTEQYCAEKENSQESIPEFTGFQLLTPKLEKID